MTKTVTHFKVSLYAFKVPPYGLPATFVEGAPRKISTGEGAPRKISTGGFSSARAALDQAGSVLQGMAFAQWEGCVVHVVKKINQERLTSKIISITDMSFQCISISCGQWNVLHSFGADLIECVKKLD